MFLKGFEQGSPVAVETIGNWYWVVDEIEEAGMIPKLVHARKAKLMMDHYSKSDKLDARGMKKFHLLLYRIYEISRRMLPRIRNVGH